MCISISEMHTGGVWKKGEIKEEHGDAFLKLK